MELKNRNQEKFSSFLGVEEAWKLGFLEVKKRKIISIIEGRVGERVVERWNGEKSREMVDTLSFFFVLSSFLLLTSIGRDEVSAKG